MGNPTIPLPNLERVRECADNWGEQYNFQDQTLKYLFDGRWNEKRALEQMLLKVTALDQFYHTQIPNPYTVAVHLLKQTDFDQRIKERDLKLVNEIASVEFISEGEKWKERLYSFMTKFCSFHSPEFFPIYDAYVDSMLWYYKKNGDWSSDFHRCELKDYPTFERIVRDFQRNFGLQQCEFRMIDKFLWTLGKRYFRTKEKQRIL